MANDRYFLRCKECGEHTTMAKYYPTLARYGIDNSDFVTEHMLQCINDYPLDLDGRVIFEILTELDLVKLHKDSA